MDFDDLLGSPSSCSASTPTCCARTSSGSSYVLVDEYQDTNHAQYGSPAARRREPQHLRRRRHDQSIYRFRGADIRNILEFEEDFPDVRRSSLEQNYRSTKTILDAANAVIANNLRKPKTLWTDAGGGERIVRYHAEDEPDEASWVAGTMPSAPQRRRHDCGARSRSSTAPTPRAGCSKRR